MDGAPPSSEFATYEDYLDSQIKPEDMFYLNVYKLIMGKVNFRMKI